MRLIRLHTTLIAYALLVSLVGVGCRSNTNTRDQAQSTANNKPNMNEQTDAASIHRRALVMDMHVDTVQRLVDENVNLNERLANGHLDAVRMREGGLDAQFFAVWVEPQFYGERGARAVERADEQIEAIERLVASDANTWQLATSADEVRRANVDGKLAVLIGLEGGYAIDENLENVEKYFRRGVRYMSLTWGVSVSWAGSSGDEVGQTRGLNDFGKGVVREMNRLGMIVDVSHVSDKTFRDIIETSNSPVVATHSNARAVCNVARNLDDEQIRQIARTGGVVNVVFYSAFIEPGWDVKKQAVDREIAALVDAASNGTNGTPSQKRMARDRVREREYARRLPAVTVARVADHIDHIVRLVGVEHVGIGSDFDGIQAVPKDLSSVADLPNLTAELLRRGYTAGDIEKIMGGNMLRVLEATAAKASGREARK